MTLIHLGRHRRLGRRDKRRQPEPGLALPLHSSALGAVVGEMVLLFLSACGGGGDSAPPVAAAGAASAAPAAPTTASTPPSTCGLPDFPAAVLARINQLRATGATCGSAGSFAAAPALSWNGKLSQAADAHSKDMVANNYFSHTSADGRTLADRVNAAGYAWAGLGENIAAGYPTVDAVMDGWIASPGHCQNLLNAGFSEVGVACVPAAAGSTYASYWTMDLGRPR